MAGVRARFVRWVADEPQPGMVEASLMDAHGVEHRFIDKTAIFTAELITARTDFPRDFVLPVAEVRRSAQADGRTLVTVSTAGMRLEDLTGRDEFDLRDDQLIAG